MVVLFVRDVSSTQKKAQVWIDNLPANPTQWSDKQKNEFYAIGYHYYRKGDYSRAIPFFEKLISAEPQKGMYWMGLAGCFKMLKNYQQALITYAKAFLIGNEKGAELFVFAADCHFGLKQIDQGLEALEKAYQIASKGNNQTILNHVAFMRQLWSSKK